VERKAWFLGVIHLVYGEMCRLYPEIRGKLSPRALDEKRAEFVRTSGCDGLPPSAAEADMARMDSGAVPAVKEVVEDGYGEILKPVGEACDAPDWDVRVENFIAALRHRTVRKFIVKSRYTKLALLIAFIYGSVASGDVDTTAMNSWIALLILLEGLDRAVESGAVDRTRWELLTPESQLTGHPYHIEVAGDDMAILSPYEGDAEAIMAEAVAFAKELGYVLEGRPSSLVGPDARLSFCSRLCLPIESSAGVYEFMSIRMPARVLARFGWTTRQGVNSERTKRRLMLATALSELSDLTHARHGTLPILGALVEATLVWASRPGLVPLFDRQTAHRLLASIDAPQLDGSGSVIQRAARVAKGLARRARPPSGALRVAFADLTGIEPLEQIAEEANIRRQLSAGRRYYYSDVLATLQRDEWR
jgi:hypothetical protein